MKYERFNGILGNELPSVLFDDEALTERGIEVMEDIKESMCYSLLLVFVARANGSRRECGN